MITPKSLILSTTFVVFPSIFTNKSIKMVAADIDPFYEQYAHGGLISAEIFANGIVALICTTGICLNLCLVYVTIKTKSLHSPCKLLLALYALSSSFLLFGSSIKFFVFLFGVNYISLKLCFCIQFVPLIGSSVAVSLQIGIGIDRLLGVKFPIWYKSHGKFITYKFIIAFCCVRSAINACSNYIACSYHWEKQVMCNLGDPSHLPENRHFTDLNAFIIYFCEFLCYASISFILWRQQSQISEDVRKLTISLSVLMSIGLICFVLNICVMKGIMPLLNLDAVTMAYFASPISLSLQTMAYGSGAPVLYFCSGEYRCALRSLFCHHQSVSTTSAVAIVQVISSNHPQISTYNTN